MKISRPKAVGEVQPPPRPKSAQEAMVEKSRARYIHLECGHITDWETDELYRVWAPSRYVHYCDACGKWRKVKPKPKKEQLPDEPLF